MKIIKTLFVHSLILASVLASISVGLNIYAADQSICNSGANVFLHQNGSLKSCQLKDDYDANDIRCKNGATISFYSNGKLESCVLFESVTIGNNTCKADAQISFQSDGTLKSCMKKDD